MSPESANPKVKVLIIEDEESIRSGLCDVFVYHGYEVDSASDGEEGLKKALTGRYHLILTDIMLPGKDGLAVCDAIRKADRAQPLILLTAKGDEEDIIKGLKLGADDYITKPFSVRELVARAEAVLRRSQKLVAQQEKIVWEGIQIDPRNLTAIIDGREVELTRREVDLLRYLIQFADRPVGRGELLKEVWGYGNVNMDTRTVDIHLAKLRRKIEKTPDEPRILITVRGEGYRIGKG